MISAIESQPVSQEQVRDWFEHNPPGRVQYRLVAMLGEEIAGYAGFVHEASAPAGHCKTWVLVHPDRRGRGAGSALWAATLAALQNARATRLECDLSDQDPASLAFAERRGFAASHRMYRAMLDLAGFDETPYLPALHALESQGIRFGSLAGFADTPQTRRKLHELNSANERDIPNMDGRQTAFAEFEQFVLNALWFRREGQLLAVDGDAWVGLAAVSLDAAAGRAWNEHTGVLRAYRGRKIAQSLKVLAALYARGQGAAQIGTDVDTTNAPMLAINRKMGYQPQDGTVILVRLLA